MKTLEERFFEKVHINTKSGCWEWTAYRNRRGYGLFAVRKKPLLSHRVAYEMTGKKIQDGCYVCHTCDNPSCVNPFHLFQGTQWQNMQDMKQKGRSPCTRGESSCRSKLTEPQVKMIRLFLKRFPSTQKRKSFSYGSVSFLAKWFGVGRSGINAAQTGATWSHIK